MGFRLDSASGLFFIVIPNRVNFEYHPGLVEIGILQLIDRQK